MLLSIKQSAGFRVGFVRRVRSVVALVVAMRQAIEGRREIARMDDRMLSDIGISRGEAQVEASRRPWETGATLNRRKYTPKFRT